MKKNKCPLYTGQHKSTWLELGLGVNKGFAFFLFAAAAALEEVDTESVCGSHNRFFEVKNDSPLLF